MNGSTRPAGHQGPLASKIPSSIIILYNIIIK